MSFLYNDEYINVISNILKNKEFNKLKTIAHHDSNRMIHSLKVSYYSYKLSKKIGLDYKEAARGGLLHDFFFIKYDLSNREKAKLLKDHPFIAVKNAKALFDINDKEKNIIESHMFPAGKVLPKHSESWVVNIVDKGVSLVELISKWKYKTSTVLGIWILLLLNYMK